MGGETLPDLPGGYSWRSHFSGQIRPDVHLRALMREAEERLVGELLDAGSDLVVGDGPLAAIGSTRRPAIGYIKTHRTMHLSSDHHAQIPQLAPGERTSLFRIERFRYSCYLRLRAPERIFHPWSSIVRLEIPGALSLRDAAHLADIAAATLPRLKELGGLNSRVVPTASPTAKPKRHPL